MAEWMCCCAGSTDSLAPVVTGSERSKLGSTSDGSGRSTSAPPLQPLLAPSARALTRPGDGAQHATRVHTHAPDGGEHDSLVGPHSPPHAPFSQPSLSPLTPPDSAFGPARSNANASGASDAKIADTFGVPGQHKAVSAGSATALGGSMHIGRRKFAGAQSAAQRAAAQCCDVGGVGAGTEISALSSRAAPRNFLAAAAAHAAHRARSAAAVATSSDTSAPVEHCAAAAVTDDGSKDIPRATHVVEPADASVFKDANDAGGEAALLAAQFAELTGGHAARAGAADECIPLQMRDERSQAEHGNVDKVCTARRLS